MSILNDDPELKDLLASFIAGPDRSLQLANRIEGLLIERHINTKLFEELSMPLASYRPGGGEHLYDEDDLIQEFAM